MEKKKPPNSHSKDKTLYAQCRKCKPSNPFPQKVYHRPSLLKRRLLEAQTTFVAPTPSPNFGVYSMSSQVAPQYTPPPPAPVYSLPRSVGYLTRSYASPCRRRPRPHDLDNTAYKPYWRGKEQLCRLKEPHINRDDLRRKTLETVRRLDAQRMLQRLHLPRSQLLDMKTSIASELSKRLDTTPPSEIIDFNEIERARANVLRRQEYIKHYSSYVEGCDQWMPLDMTNRNRLGKFENVIPNNFGQANITPCMDEKEELFERSKAPDVCRKYACKGTMISFKTDERTCEINVTLTGCIDENEKTQAFDEKKSDERDTDSALKESMNDKMGSEDDLTEVLAQGPQDYNTKELKANTDMDNENDKVIQSHPSSLEYSTANENDMTDKNKREAHKRNSSGLKKSSSKVSVKNIIKKKLKSALHNNDIPEHDIDKVKIESQILKLDGKNRPSQIYATDSKDYLENMVEKEINNAPRSGTKTQVNATDSKVYLKNIVENEINNALLSGTKTQVNVTDSKDYLKNIVENEINNALQSGTKTQVNVTDSKDYLKNIVENEVNIALQSGNKTNGALQSKNADDNREIQSEPKLKNLKKMLKNGLKMSENSKKIDSNFQNYQDSDSHVSQWIMELVDNETVRGLSRDTINTSENKTSSSTEPIEHTSILSKYIINTHDSINSKTEFKDIDNSKNIAIEIEKSLESFVSTNFDLTLENTESTSQFAFSTSQNIYRMSCPNMISPLKEKYHQIRSQSVPYFTYSNLDELDSSFLEQKFSDKIRTTLAFPSDSISHNGIVCSSESLSSDAISLYMRNLEVYSNCTESTLIRLPAVNSNILGDIESEVIRNTEDMSTEMFAQDLGVFLGVADDSK